MNIVLCHLFVVLGFGPYPSNVPKTMPAVRSAGACNAPFPCVKVESVPTPRAGFGKVLIQVNGSSVNPSDVDTVEGGGCTNGCGADVSGTVVECVGCKRLKVGDEVWTIAEGAYADYVTSPESFTSLKPAVLPHGAAATIPEVGIKARHPHSGRHAMASDNSVLSSTLIFANSRPLVAVHHSNARMAKHAPRQSPLGSRPSTKNLTIAITAGSGGTGFIGIELAKAYGAVHIATATTGADGIAFVRSLGATIVVDYKKEDLFESLPDNSVDIVYDNYGAEGTADKAMRTIRPGGVYLLMPHGECFEKKTQGPPCLSAHPKPGVTQLNYVTGPDFDAHALQGLDELAALFNAGKLSAHVDQTFSLQDAAKAFAYSAGPGEGGVGEHIGKISITMQ